MNGIGLAQQKHAEVGRGHVDLLLPGLNAARPVKIASLAFREILKIYLAWAGLRVVQGMGCVQHEPAFGTGPEELAIRLLHALRKVNVAGWCNVQTFGSVCVGK